MHKEANIRTLIDKLATILVEGPKQDVQTMFANVEMSKESQQRIADEFDWAQSVLKKSERIIWYMRLWRLDILRTQSQLVAKELLRQQPPHDSAEIDKIDVLFNQKRAGLSRRDLLSTVGYATGRAFKTDFAHYLSLDIDGIDKIVFGWQTPREILETMVQLEKQWQEKQRFELNPGEDHDLIMEFKDGWGWWNLNTASCSEEGQAMGHCGNSPRSSSDDTILSLRQQGVNKRGEEKIQPWATFILRADGALTEMKGRYNEKPQKELHPYIVALIKSDHVDSVVGGGYMPENNFHYDDLTNEADKKDVQAKWKPTISELFAKMGATEKFTDILEQRLYDNGIAPDTFRIVEGTSRRDPEIVIKEWPTFENFVRYDMDDHIVAELLDLYEDIEPDSGSNTPEDDEEYLYRALESLSDDMRAMVFRDIGIKDKGRQSNMDAIYELNKQDSRFLKYMYDAYDRSFKISEEKITKLKKEIFDRIQLYIGSGWSFSSSYATSIHFEDNMNFDATVEARISLRVLVEAVAIIEEEDDEYGYEQSEEVDIHSIRDDGWAGRSYQDGENDNEYRRDEGLIETRATTTEHLLSNSKYSSDKYQDAWLSETIDDDETDLTGEVDFPEAMDRLTKLINLNESKNQISEGRMVAELLYLAGVRSKIKPK